MLLDASVSNALYLRMLCAPPWSASQQVFTRLAALRPSFNTGVFPPTGERSFVNDCVPCVYRSFFPSGSHPILDATFWERSVRQSRSYLFVICHPTCLHLALDIDKNG